MEASFAEAVRKVLYDYRFAFGRADRGMDLGTGSPWKEEGGARTLGNVLHVEDGESTLPKGLDELGRFAHSSLRANEFHCSAREVVVLQVDEDKGCGHDEWCCVRPNVRRKWQAQVGEARLWLSP